MIIIIQCIDRSGLLAAISDVFAGESIQVISMHEYRDTIDHLFYVRIETGIIADVKKLKERLRCILPVDASVKLRSLPEKKVIIMVSKEYHCLADILIRNQFKTLGASVQCVIGNHAILQNICERFEIPFHLVSHEKLDKESFENQLLHTISQYEADYLVLAKFMRILSPEFTRQFPLHIINIHHSFLPAFAGANPYRQAFYRGVKLIGATAHFVTSELDEGPIIAQQAIPVSHSFTPGDMIKAGREIETAVLAKALQLVFDDRVFIYQNKTVVLE
jgi:formyltetrahydrofolate deformylase